MKTITAVIVLLLLSRAAFAQDARMQKAARIGKALGIEAALKSAQLESAKQAKQQILSILEELRKNDVPEAILKLYSDQADTIAERIRTAWAPEVASRLYADGLVELLSDSELVAAERYYASDIGKRTYAAIETSSRNMLDYITQRTNEATKAELAQLILRVREAIKRWKGSGAH
jgi:hypothetical protein